MKERELTAPSAPWTPKFVIEVMEDKHAFAVFENIDAAFEYDLLYPQVFNGLELLTCGCGGKGCNRVSFRLGKIQ